jgi:hypothetical protein
MNYSLKEGRGGGVGGALCLCINDKGEAILQLLL